MSIIQMYMVQMTYTLSFEMILNVAMDYDKLGKGGDLG